jgi:predicted CXXCH cytochrome family protein
MTGEARGGRLLALMKWLVARERLPEPRRARRSPVMEGTSPLAHAKHVVRAALILLVFLVVLVLGRSAFVPPSWGEYGSYRASSVPELMAKPVIHGGRTACASCHPDEHDTVLGGGHARVQCEICHAPLAVHAANEEKIADMPVRRAAELCLGCHQRLAARPRAFPQIEPATHLEENGAEPGQEACVECHDPHEPL